MFDCTGGVCFPINKIHAKPHKKKKDRKKNEKNQRHTHRKK